ncbi:MAG: Rrf2 family transcriptional regulator [Sulfuricurvum sp. PC08-66]|nr:MAG: Rrf2 family transcriptional regulator [Sulfuricurvum sp. PC08-66]
MLLTRASEYALLALIVLAQAKEPMGADRIALQLGISKSFLAKVLQSLAKEQLLLSYKGVRGGFALARSEHQITLLDIMQAAEGKSPAVFDCSPSHADCPSQIASACAIWPVLNNLQNKIDNFLVTLTLADIMRGHIG